MTATSTTAGAPLLGVASWRGEDLARTTDCIRTLTDAEVEELDAALRLIRRRGLDWKGMTHDDFAIPRLARSARRGEP